MIRSFFGWRAAALGVLVATIAVSPAVAKPAAAQPQSKLTAPAHQGGPASRANQAKPAGSSAVLSTGAARGKATGGPNKGLSSVDTSQCVPAQFSQPFGSFGDFHWYTLAPGEAVGNFTGSGWTLRGGAAIVGAALGAGRSGEVLDLPAGSSADSPPMCVASNYPTGRAMIRDVVDTAGVRFAVSYEGTKSWMKPRVTGLVHANSTGWGLSNRFGVHPYDTFGWQLVRFHLSVPTDGGEYQIYNLYVDPFMRK
jgi:hypothetical protein